MEKFCEDIGVEPENVSHKMANISFLSIVHSVVTLCFSTLS